MPLPTIQCHVGSYIISNSVFMISAISSRTYFCWKACWQQSTACYLGQADWSGLSVRSPDKLSTVLLQLNETLVQTANHGHAPGKYSVACDTKYRMPSVACMTSTARLIGTVHLGALFTACASELASHPSAAPVDLCGAMWLTTTPAG